MDMAVKAILVLALTSAGVVLGERPYSMTDCARRRPTKLLRFAETNVSPYPVVVPGDFSVMVSMEVYRDAVAHIAFDVTIERYFGFFWLKIPCISDVGSCTYPDLCTMLSNTYGRNTSGCPPQLVENNVPCTCPVPAGTYRLNNAVFSVAQITGVWAWLIRGDYRVKARLIDSRTGEEIACQKMELSIVNNPEACQSFFCLFS